MDYYTFEKGVLKKIENPEMRILLKYLVTLFLGLVVGLITYWIFTEGPLQFLSE